MWWDIWFPCKMIMKQRGFSSLPWLKRQLSQSTECSEKVKLIMRSGQVTGCCGKSVISVFIHFVLWVTIVRKLAKISCQSFANAFVGHLFGSVCALVIARHLCFYTRKNGQAFTEHECTNSARWATLRQEAKQWKKKNWSKKKRKC